MFSFFNSQNCIQKINSTRNVTTTIAQSLSKDINEDRSEDNKTIEIQEKNAHTHDKRTIDHEQAIDCWLTSISAYPNVVRLFGEFSSEVLQVMLGLSKDVTTTMTDYDASLEEQDINYDSTTSINNVGHDCNSNYIENILKEEENINGMKNAGTIMSSKGDSSLFYSYLSDDTRNVVFSSFRKSNAITPSSTSSAEQEKEKNQSDITSQKDETYFVEDIEMFYIPDNDNIDKIYENYNDKNSIIAYDEGSLACDDISNREKVMIATRSTNDSLRLEM